VKRHPRIKVVLPIPFKFSINVYRQYRAGAWVGSAEEKALLQRYVRQLDAQEDRITALRTELAGLRQQREAAQAELDKTLAELTLDVAL
jgi:hypothetical protein